MEEEYFHELSICAIFRDDAKYLPEWIEFHQSQGVEHFYLYDNNSSDHPEKILKKYIKKGLVTLTGWDFEHEDQYQWNEIQIKAYMDCINKIRYSDKWCAFLDTDEFLYCPDKTPIPKVLEKYNDYSSVKVSWRCFGTSHIEKIPKHGKIIDYLVYRSNDDHPWNTFEKHILKPKYVYSCVNPHIFIFIFLDEYKMKKSEDLLRINHYWSRDMDFFYNVKIGRRLKWHSKFTDLENLESQMNSVYDPILKDF